MLPIILVGGFLMDWRAYRPFAQLLERRLGADVRIAPFTRLTWFGASALGGYATLLRLTHQTVEETLRATGAARVNFIGHSAGGSVARLYLGDVDYDGVAFAGHRRAASLITLGCPHFSLLSWTRRTVDFINHHYPGAFYSQVAYVAAIGESVRGKFPGSLAEMAAHQSYQLVCGDGSAVGDGVVPVQSGQLPGAENFVLPNIQHVPNRSEPWYDAALDRWAPFLR
jgi:pimeloyl-ACP methyl ester carboxylesterase